jgi:hypothetical protein
VLILAACSATQRYKWNSEHAHVSPGEHLMRAEANQIVRSVSEASTFPIICLSRGRGNYSNEVMVFTDLSHDPQRFMVYTLQKKTDGVWHIIDHGEGSIISCE